MTLRRVDFRRRQREEEESDPPRSIPGRVPRDSLSFSPSASFSVCANTYIRDTQTRARARMHVHTCTYADTRDTRRLVGWMFMAEREYSIQ